MDAFLFMEVFALILTGLLVWHSLRFRGNTFTWMFFLGGAVLGLLRENIVSRLTDLYSYNPAAFHWWVGSAPLILGVFWSYAIYLSLFLAEGILGNSLAAGRKRGGILLLTMAMMAAYACFNEALSSLFPMVLWKFKPAVALWGGTPVMVLWGYAGMALIFLGTLLLIHSLKRPALFRVLLMSFSSVIMIPLHLLWIAIFQKIIFSIL